MSRPENHPESLERPGSPVPASAPEHATSSIKQKREKKNKGGRNHEKLPETDFDRCMRLLLSKYRDAFEHAGTGKSPGVRERRKDVLNKVMHEVHFQFDWYFDPRRAQNAVHPPMAGLKPYDPEVPNVVPSGLTPEEDKEYVARDKKLRKCARDKLDYMVTKPKAGQNTHSSTTQAKKEAFDFGAILDPKPVPRSRAAWQEWQVRSDEKERISKIVESEFWKDVECGAEQPAEKVPLVYRQRKTREMFMQLPDDERELWAQAALDDKAVKVEQHKKLTEVHGEPTPEQRQMALERVGEVLSKLMDEALSRAGVHMLAYVYGPMPKDNGALGCLTYCSGRTNDTTPVFFTKKMPDANKQHRARIMRFANLCFTAADIEKARPSSDSPMLSTIQKHTDEIEVGNDHAQDSDDITMSQGPPASTPTGKPMPEQQQRSEKRKRNAGRTSNSRRKARGTKRRVPTSDDEDDSDESDESAAEEGSGDDGEGSEDDEEASGQSEGEDEPQAKRVRISSYEIAQEDRMARNKELLVELGLDKPFFEEPTPPRRAKRTVKSTTSQAGPPRRSLRNARAAQVDTGATPPGSPAPPPAASPAEPIPTSSVLAPSPPAPSPSPPAPPASPPAPSPSPVPPQRPNLPARDLTKAPAAASDVEATLDAIAEANRIAVTAPAWFSYPHEVLRDKDNSLGMEWQSLVAEWTLLDGECRFAQPMLPLPKGTGKAERPIILSAWMKRGYLTKVKGGINATHASMLLLKREDLKAHVTSFNAWWQFLQPDWRAQTSPAAYEGNDFGVLNTRGQTGWVLIIACLWWWGTCLAGEDCSTQAKGDWRRKVADVLLMLRVKVVLIQMLPRNVHMLERWDRHCRCRCAGIIVRLLEQGKEDSSEVWVTSSSFRFRPDIVPEKDNQNQWIDVAPTTRDIGTGRERCRQRGPPQKNAIAFGIGQAYALVCAQRPRIENPKDRTPPVAAHKVILWDAGVPE
ncbi:hypothetical protein CYLTODRAFT_476617 [Cylindrobasidium torrendii FP15055 ss-10]|uniref:Uncharacterized protein n=1 Tax=Cylindrobasidium torrendii FP15055 ss-10 TaxID=1314674 RepID=A0A0D7AV59_9AGAR|nr:hypothetical protein CYLTODRAFT_476617 [Cylindrobasidium torrendii FP15055 ss-10]